MSRTQPFLLGSCAKSIKIIYTLIKLYRRGSFSHKIHLGNIVLGHELKSAPISSEISKSGLIGEMEHLLLKHFNRISIVG